MSLPTNRQDGDVIENEDINAIASEVNRISEALESDSGTSGSAVLIVRTSSLATIPPGTTEGELVGYRNSAASTITIAGEALESGDWAVWGWFGGAWVLLNESGSSGGIVVPDATPPTPGTLSASNIADTSFTLTVSGASDNQGLHPQPYRFSVDDGYSFSTWQSSPTFNATGRAPGSATICQHEVCDVAGNAAKGAKITVNTLTSAHDVFDDFNRFGGANNTILSSSHSTLTGQTYVVGPSWPRGAGGTTDQGPPCRLGRMDLLGSRGVMVGLASNHVRIAFDYAADVTSTARLVRVGVGSSTTDNVMLQIRQAATDITFRPVHNSTEITTGVTPYVITAATLAPTPIEIVHDGATLAVSVGGVQRFTWAIPTAVTGSSLGIGCVGGAQSDYYIDNLAVDYLP